MVGILNLHGLLSGDFLSPAVRASYGVLLDKQVEELTVLLDSTTEKSNQLAKDRGLTLEGRGSRQNQLAQESWKKLDSMTTRRRGKLEQDLKRAREGVPEGLNLTEQEKSAAGQIRHVEIRSHLLDLPQLVRAAAVESAAERGDRETLIAAQGAPLLIQSKIIDGVKLEKATAKFLELHHPESFKTLDTIEGAVSVYDSNSSSAFKLIASSTGATAPAEAVELIA